MTHAARHPQASFSAACQDSYRKRVPRRRLYKQRSIGPEVSWFRDHFLILFGPVYSMLGLYKYRIPRGLGYCYRTLGKRLGITF
jgi:hypothetical protein